MDRTTCLDICHSIFEADLFNKYGLMVEANLSDFGSYYMLWFEADVFNIDMDKLLNYLKDKYGLTDGRIYKGVYAYEYKYVDRLVYPKVTEDQLDKIRVLAKLSN